MKGKLTERYPGTALITGASSGIGKAFAERLAREGFDLALVARREQRLVELKGELEAKHPVRVLPIAVDLTAADALATIRRALSEAERAVSLLVNNAGYGSHGPFHEQDPEREARMIDLNCKAPMLLTHALVPAMVERKNGGVIFVASIAGYQPCPYFATYGATKSFNLMFGEALWAELGPLGVDVVVLSPGYTRTEFQEVSEIQSQPLTGWKSSEQVVDTALRKLGHGPSTIPGVGNFLTAWSTRLTPRRLVARISARVSAPKK